MSFSISVTFKFFFLSLNFLRFLCSLFFSIFPPPPRSTLFPYTTLFRSSPPIRVPSRASRRRRLRASVRRRGIREPRGRPWGSRASSSLALRERRSAKSVPSKHLFSRSEEHTSELQSHSDLVCRLLLEKK